MCACVCVNLSVFSGLWKVLVWMCVQVLSVCIKLGCFSLFSLFCHCDAYMLDVVRSLFWNVKHYRDFLCKVKQPCPACSHRPHTLMWHGSSVYLFISFSLNCNRAICQTAAHICEWPCQMCTIYLLIILLFTVISSFSVHFLLEKIILHTAWLCHVFVGSFYWGFIMLIKSEMLKWNTKRKQC